MAIVSALLAFSAEYLGDHPAYEDFEEYLRMEFVKRRPGWEPSFGRATRFERDVQAYDYMFLPRGNSPKPSRTRMRRAGFASSSTRSPKA